MAQQKNLLIKSSIVKWWHCPPSNCFFYCFNSKVSQISHDPLQQLNGSELHKDKSVPCVDKASNSGTYHVGMQCSTYQCTRYMSLCEYETKINCTL